MSASAIFNASEQALAAYANLDANWTFFDKGTDTTVEVDSATSLSRWLPEHSVRFGGSGADTLDGGGGTDRANDYAWAVAA